MLFEVLDDDYSWFQVANRNQTEKLMFKGCNCSRSTTAKFMINLVNLIIVNYHRIREFFWSVLILYMNLNMTSMTITLYFVQLLHDRFHPYQNWCDTNIRLVPCRFLFDQKHWKYCENYEYKISFCYWRHIFKFIWKT